MFDFFLRYSATGHLPEGAANPFGRIPAYRELKYIPGTFKAPGYSLHTLHRHNDAESGIYDSDDLLIAVYGYLFREPGGDIAPGSFVPPGKLADYIRNSGEFRHSDFRGSYSLIIIHKSKNELTIVTDPLNVKSVYLESRSDSYILSSSLDAMILSKQSQGEDLQLNRLQILNQLIFDLIPGEETLIKGVQTVPAATRLFISRNGVKTFSGWNPLIELPVGSPKFGKKESIALLNSYLKNQLLTFNTYPGNLAMALTGGYDSRLLASLLGKQASEVAFYSYGHPDSWDIRIPAGIAADMKWKYETFQFGESFKAGYAYHAAQALSFTAGTALFTQADIPYIYSNHLLDKSAIISGLFGSELLKYPSGRGLVVNENMLSLLFSAEPETTLGELFEASAAAEYLGRDNKPIRDEFIHSWLSDPMLDSIRHLDKTHKFFYYLVNWGARKYFAKEISMERPFVENLTPFWDPGFIRLLLQTPYSWVHMPWSGKKSSLTNLKLHGIYAKMIQSNSPRLAGYMSTHATRPLFLTHPVYLPLLVTDYKLYRKRIKKQTYSCSRKLISGYEKQQQDLMVSFPQTFSDDSERSKIKLISLQSWCAQYQLII